MYLKIVAVAIGIFLLSCVVLPNLISETDEGTTYKEPTQNPDQPIERSDDYKWFTETPEGQDLLRRANESDNPEQFLKDYFRWTGEGETHEEALQSWRGVPRRIARDVSQIPSELKTIRRDPFGGIEQHYTGYAFPTGLFNIVRGNFDLTDIFGALLVPCVVIFVLTRQQNLRSVIALIWFADLIIDLRFWLQHLVATAIVAGLTVLVRWAIQRVKEASANK